jgi:Uma2 family endonuclease
MHEIVLPDNVKPALEWVNNRIVQKVSPKRKHALTQLRFASVLGRWADSGGRGMAGTEWHFQVQPPGEIGRTLIPDVAFLSYDRMPLDELEATEIPRIAPDVVVEIRSPDDRVEDIEEKVRVYLAAGTKVVFLVDTDRKSVVARERSAMRVVGEHETLTHDALPDFSMPVRSLFDLPRPRRSPSS